MLVVSSVSWKGSCWLYQVVLGRFMLVVSSGSWKGSCWLYQAFLGKVHAGCIKRFLERFVLGPLLLGKVTSCVLPQFYVTGTSFLPSLAVLNGWSS